MQTPPEFPFARTPALLHQAVILKTFLSTGIQAPFLKQEHTGRFRQYLPAARRKFPPGKTEVKMLPRVLSFCGKPWES